MSDERLINVGMFLMSIGVATLCFAIAYQVLTRGLS